LPKECALVPLKIDLRSTSFRRAKEETLMHIISALSIWALAIVATPVALAQGGGHEDTGPLPESATTNPAAIRPPAGAFERLGTQNAGIRSVFHGTGPANANVEIRELIVAPHSTVRFDPVPGITLFDVRGGEAMLRVDAQPPTQAAAGVTTVPAGQSLEITGGDTPSVLRLYSVEVR
jgi:hypothetical protein